jgi:hypothetical protein
MSPGQRDAIESPGGWLTTVTSRICLNLDDVFRYPFDEVAGTVGRTPAACRQLASSARRRVRAAQPPAGPAAQTAAVIRAFGVAGDRVKRIWVVRNPDKLRPWSGSPDRLPVRE